jgi:uncharacterized protein YbaP (TraB family)
VPTAEQVAAGARSARDRGFLWRITKDGRTSYLYGTIHVGKLEWVFPGKTVSTALMDTDTLALELDLTDPQVLQAASAAERVKTVPLSPALRERLDRQYSVACVPGSALASLHPVMQAMTLTVMAARWEGLDPAYGQELSLAGLARSTRHQVVSLETVQSQLQTLVPDDEQAALALVDQTLAQLEQNRVRPALARMGAAWENGNLATLESYEQWCDCITNDSDRAYMRQLNDGRNPHLAERIDALHREGRKVFAAVGALHMTGPQALPRLMAERGYAVERVTFPR